MNNIIHATQIVGLVQGLTASGKTDEAIKTVASMLENMERRKDSDLDSIEVGTPAKGGALKVYFDSVKDDTVTLKMKVDLAMVGVNHARTLLTEVKA